jgi:hypothetical protein
MKQVKCKRVKTIWHSIDHFSEWGIYGVAFEVGTIGVGETSC